jgi:hypothetical protein
MCQDGIKTGVVGKIENQSVNIDGFQGLPDKVKNKLHFNIISNHFDKSSDPKMILSKINSDSLENAFCNDNNLIMLDSF